LYIYGSTQRFYISCICHLCMLLLFTATPICVLLILSWTLEFSNQTSHLETRYHPVMQSCLVLISVYVWIIGSLLFPITFMYSVLSVLRLIECSAQWLKSCKLHCKVTWSGDQMEQWTMPFVATHRLSVWIWTPTTTTIRNTASPCPADVWEVAEFQLSDSVRDKTQVAHTKHRVCMDIVTRRRLLSGRTLHCHGPTRIMQATSWSPHKMRGWGIVVKTTSHKSLLLYLHNINVYHQQLHLYWVSSCIKAWIAHLNFIH